MSMSWHHLTVCKDQCDLVRDCFKCQWLQFVSNKAKLYDQHVCFVSMVCFFVSNNSSAAVLLMNMSISFFGVGCLYFFLLLFGGDNLRIVFYAFYFRYKTMYLNLWKMIKYKENKLFIEMGKVMDFCCCYCWL